MLIVLIVSDKINVDKGGIMNHVVLLGDSIFDNGIWATGGLSVIEHLRNILGRNWKATLLAIDGSTTEGIDTQLEKIPEDANLLFVSLGGNNALQNMGMFFEPAKSTTDVLENFSDMSADFQLYYSHMLKKVLNLKLPTAICTIYFPRFPDPKWQKSVLSALTYYNDCIIREAIKMHLPILDLRFVCTESNDFTNAIEPSAMGGEKIAHAISRLINRHDFTRPITSVYI
jgi:hypothetical protein